MEEQNNESLPNNNSTIGDQEKTQENEGEKQEKSISLLNYDPNTSQEPILSSPRSLDACLRQGIKPKDLLKMTKEQIKSFLGKEKRLDEKDLETFSQHFEARREKKIQMLLQVREEIMEEERLGLWRPGQLQSASGSSTFQRMPQGSGYKSFSSLTLIDNEKKLLEKIKKRQDLELQKMIDAELKEENLREYNFKKEENLRRREQERMQYLQLRKKTEEESEKIKEKERKEKELRDQSEEATKRLLDYKKEQERIRKKAEEDELKEKERKKMEALKEAKVEEARKKTMQIFEEQEKEIEKRKNEIYEKEKKHLEFLEWKKNELTKVNEERAKQHQGKFENSKKHSDEILENRRRNFEEKQIKNNQRQLIYEKSKEQYFNELNKKGEERNAKIKEVLQLNEAQMEKKTENYLKRKQIEQERKEKLQNLHAQLEEARRQNNDIRCQKILAVIVANEQQEEQRKNEIIKKMNETDLKVRRVQEKKMVEIHDKQNIDLLKKIDLNENMQRMIEISELKKAKMLEKIHLDYMRSEAIMKERNEVIRMKQELRKKLDYERERLLKDFELKRKKNKMMDFVKNRDSSLSPENADNTGELAEPKQETENDVNNA